MPVSERETIASLRVLVCVANADGKVHPEERAQLEAGLADVALPAGVTLRNLLDEEGNLDALLKQITSEEGRDACYTSAYALAYSDGVCHPGEQKILDRIKQTYNLPEEKTSLLGRVFSEARDTVLPSNIAAVSDPAKRAKEIREDTFKYAVLSAALGAFPIPGLSLFTDLAVIGLQVKLIRDIGQYYGHQIDKGAANSLLLGVGVSTGARIAVSNLVKFLPGVGSAVGAASSFAATWAVGKLAVSYFENDCKADMKTLKQVFQAAEQEGKTEYTRNKETIRAKSQASEGKIKSLAEQRKAGKISEAEYEKQVSDLA